MDKGLAILDYAVIAAFFAVMLGVGLYYGRKAKAVAGAVDGPHTNMCPSSILRNHADCTLFLDPPAASLLKK